MYTRKLFLPDAVYSIWHHRLGHLAVATDRLSPTAVPLVTKLCLLGHLPKLIFGGLFPQKLSYNIVM
jgi:hypothetical protein